jgi:hypothetical protein
MQHFIPGAPRHVNVIFDVLIDFFLGRMIPITYLKNLIRSCKDKSLTAHMLKRKNYSIIKISK